MSTIESASLRDRSLGSVLTELAEQSFSGIVHVEGTEQRMIAFDAGRIYLAMGSTGPSIQRACLDGGVVTPAGWQRAMELLSTHGSVVGALSAVGADRAALHTTMHELTMATILELLVPTDDELRVDEGATHRLGAEISFSVRALLDEAGLRLERWSSHRERLPSLSTVVYRVENLPVGRLSVDLNRLQWRIVCCLDAPKRLSTLIEHLDIGAFAVFDELEALVTAGVVTTADAAGG